MDEEMTIVQTLLDNGLEDAIRPMAKDMSKKTMVKYESDFQDKAMSFVNKSLAEGKQQMEEALQMVKVVADVLHMGDMDSLFDGDMKKRVMDTVMKCYKDKEPMVSDKVADGSIDALRDLDKDGGEGFMGALSEGMDMLKNPSGVLDSLDKMMDKCLDPILETLKRSMNEDLVGFMTEHFKATMEKVFEAKERGSGFLDTIKSTVTSGVTGEAKAKVQDVVNDVQLKIAKAFQHHLDELFALLKNHLKKDVKDKIKGKL